MPKHKTIEHEINDFVEAFDMHQLIQFFKDVFPLVDLYDVDEEGDWVKDIVGEENLTNVRIIRTVYLLSKIADNHASALASIKCNFRNLYLRMEKEASLGMNR